MKEKYYLNDRGNIISTPSLTSKSHIFIINITNEKLFKSNNNSNKLHSKSYLSINLTIKLSLPNVFSTVTKVFNSHSVTALVTMRSLIARPKCKVKQ